MYAQRSVKARSRQAHRRRSAGLSPAQPTVPPTGAGHNTQTHTDLGRWQLTIAIVEQSAILTERRSALHRFITLSLRISHAEGGWVREDVVGRTAGGGGAEAARAAEHGRAGALERQARIQQPLLHLLPRSAISRQPYFGMPSGLGSSHRRTRVTRRRNVRPPVGPSMTSWCR